MALDAHEFIRRILLHTLPDGFNRIRCCDAITSRVCGSIQAVCQPANKNLLSDLFIGSGKAQPCKMRSTT
jgi:hypothetical protein